MDVTVLICTRDREEALARVLDSVARASVPGDLAWELLIVDNGSSDGTAALVRSFAPRLPIRSVREEVPGLSNARNRGVAEARGRHIVWTDDDVVVDPGWLAAYWQAFREHPEAAFFGGRIRPVLEGPTPSWLVENLDLMEPLLAGRDFGDEPFTIREGDERLPFGANFAVRAADQRAHPYDPGLGVSPTMRRSGEETQMFRAMLAAGRVGRWVPGSEVSHIFPARRQTYAYVVQHYRAYGETGAYLAARGGEAAPTPVERGRILYRLVKSRVAMALGDVLARRRFRLRHTCYYGLHRGVLDYWRQARTG